MNADSCMTKQWLLNPDHVGLRAEDLPAGKAIRVPDKQADRAQEVALADNNDPLVSVTGELPVFRVYQQMPLETLPRDVRLRQGLLERLVAARDSLSAPFSLVLIDGWRSLAFQRELLDYYALRHTSLEGYVSDPGDERLVPPHVTGGAVDLTLTHNGRPLSMGTDFDAFEDAAAVDWFEDPRRARGPAGELIRRLRRHLASTLMDQGLAPLAEEWWHWSFGDQRWAVCQDETQTRYGLVPS
jgi:D-alanyl-D-alanine dipeptidase